MAHRGGQQEGHDHQAAGEERGGEAEDGRGSAVCVGGRLDIGTSVEKQPGDFDDIRGCFLAEAFDAVGGDVVQERRVMGTRRAGRDEARVQGEEFAQGLTVAPMRLDRDRPSGRSLRFCSKLYADVLSTNSPRL